MTNTTSTDCNDEHDTGACIITQVQNMFEPTCNRWPNYRYYQVNFTWQQHICQQLLPIQCRAAFECSPGGPDIVLTHPDLSRSKQIAGDGNCLFRAFSFILTGSEEQHFPVRSLIVNHMLTIEHLLLGTGPDGLRNYASGMMRETCIADYIVHSEMDKNMTWGTAIEIATAAHLFNVPVYVYDTSHSIKNWIKYFPWQVDRGLTVNINLMGMYLHFTGDHFNVIRAVRQ